MALIWTRFSSLDAHFRIDNMEQTCVLMRKAAATAQLLSCSPEGPLLKPALLQAAPSLCLLRLTGKSCWGVSSQIESSYHRGERIFHPTALEMAPQEKTGVTCWESRAKPWPRPRDALAERVEAAMRQTQPGDPWGEGHSIVLSDPLHCSWRRAETFGLKALGVRTKLWSQQSEINVKDTLQLEELLYRRSEISSQVREQLPFSWLGRVLPGLSHHTHLTPQRRSGHHSAKNYE